MLQLSSIIVHFVADILNSRWHSCDFDIYPGAGHLNKTLFKHSYPLSYSNWVQNCLQILLNSSPRCERKRCTHAKFKNIEQCFNRLCEWNSHFQWWFHELENVTNYISKNSPQLSLKRAEYCRECHFLIGCQSNICWWYLYCENDCTAAIFVNYSVDFFQMDASSDRNMSNQYRIYECGIKLSNQCECVAFIHACRLVQCGKLFIVLIVVLSITLTHRAKPSTHWRWSNDTDSSGQHGRKIANNSSPRNNIPFSCNGNERFPRHYIVCMIKIVHRKGVHNR